MGRGVSGSGSIRVKRLNEATHSLWTSRLIAQMSGYQFGYEILSGGLLIGSLLEILIVPNIGYG